MLAAVDFISLAEFANIAPAADLAVVSIGDPAQMPPASLVKFAQTLRLEFLDCEWKDLAENDMPEEVLCSREQVTEISAFVENLHAAVEPLRLVVHCRMGTSRSAAVALIAQAITGCRMPRQAEANFANTHVLALAREVLGLDVEPPPMPNGDIYIYLPQRLAI